MDPHHILFPDDPDPVWRYKREAEQQEEELARQHRELERQRTMDAQTTSWAEWVDGRIDHAINRSHEAVGSVIGEEREDLSCRARQAR
jgi:hypothetical protein